MTSVYRKCKIGDLGQVVTGRTPSSTNPNYFGSKFPFITPVDMHERKSAHNTERFLSEEGAELLKRNILPIGSVAVSCIGWQMGKSILVSRPSFTNQQLNAIVPNNQVDSDYLYYLLTTKREEFFSIASASGVRTPILNKSSFCDIDIEIPEYEYQKKISLLLSCYDNLIENNSRRIAILEEMAQSLYREWFVKFRYPGHENQKLVKSPLGLIPEGWDVKRLDDFLVLQRGFDLPKQNRDSNGDIPIYAASGFSGFHNEIKAKAPGVVTGRSGTLGIVTLILEDFWPLNTSLWIKDFKNCSAFYAYYLLQGVNLERFNSGSSVPTLNRNDVHGHEVISPPIYLIKEFETFSEACHRSIKNLRNKNENLRCQRDMLLPKLISGQISLDMEGS